MQSAWSLGTKSWWESLLSQIAKMADRLFADMLCCLSLLRFIEMAKKNQQCVGPLKVTRRYLILLFKLEKDLESQIGVAS